MMTQEETRSAQLRAYEIWERDGRPDGRHESHWHQALAELGLVPAYDEHRAGMNSEARRWDEAEDQA